MKYIFMDPTNDHTLSFEELLDFVKQKKEVRVVINVEIVPRETTVLLGIIKKISELFDNYGGDGTAGNSGK